MIKYVLYCNSVGLLCFNDFVEIISTKLAEKDSKDEIMKAFRLFDRNQSGKITFENLQQIAAELGEGLNDEEVQVRYINRLLGVLFRNYKIR